MSKQIKIGLDKVPAPVTKQFIQLVDIEGTKLYDAAGNPLVTEEESALVQFTSSKSSLSVQVNNTDKSIIPIEEQFSETSQVSSSLLGVPRAEEQLSLFSDVATYGLDEEHWNSYTFTGATHPVEWYKKDHPIHGRREQPSFNEGSTEQALFLKAFPSQTSFPRGPIEKQESTPTAGFRKYMNFIALGRHFYNKFVGDHPDFAEKFFLNPDSAYVVDSGESPSVINLISTGTNAVFSGNGNFHDVFYGAPTLQESFDAVERWTYFFDQIKSGEAVLPLLTGQVVPDYTETEEYRKIISFAVNDCQPGGSSSYETIAVLESKRAFRYQPGRASGFTFGSRMASEPTTTTNYLEWGCSNDTDEYMFQLRGSQLNLVRRSTIQMPAELLQRQGLSADDQSSAPIYPRGIGNSNALWETVIPRSKFNGDNLLGTGDSGYILSFEDVTMYKIEFSWYGAIGAKFYAYIPAGNGDARWVLLHTFIIENGLGQPVLQNPDFKFKYILYSGDQRNVSSPMYLFKYGSSYYIDGGDEGTIRLSTTTADSKAFQTRTPILGLLPKNDILNSDGTPVRNYKKSYPATLSVSTDKTCRIDIEEISGSPEGVHFNFSPSIVMNGTHPRSRTLDFKYASDNQIDIVQPTNTAVTGTIAIDQDSKTVTGTGTSFTNGAGAGGVDPGDIINFDSSSLQVEFVNSDSELILASPFSGTAVSGKTITVSKAINPEDNYGKIIADGVYGVYVNSSYSSNGQSTNIYRRDPNDYNLIVKEVRDSLRLDDSLMKPTDKPTFTGKLTNYHTIVASTTPIRSNNFKIHFLDASPKNTTHASRHFGEFAVALTPYVPEDPSSGSADPNKVQFEFATGQYKDFDINEYPFIEYCHNDVFFNNKEKAEQYEWDPRYGNRLNVDPRIPSPEGVDSGKLSTVVGKVTVVDYQVDSVDAPSGSGEFGSFFKVNFAIGSATPSNTLIKFDSSGNPLSEVGAGFVGTGKFFRSTVFRPSVGNHFVYVDAGNGTTGQTIAVDLAGGKPIQTKVLTISDDWQAVSFDQDGIERFDHKKFSVGQAIRFNDQPLYPVFALQDFARVNGVVIEETSADGTVTTHTPTFVKESSSYNANISIVNSGGSNSTETPGAFNSNERLASIRYDTSALNPLRPGTVINSFYVQADQPVQMELDNVFNVDRRGISRGLLNENAIYFTATSLDGQQGTVEATITVKEQ